MKAKGSAQALPFYLRLIKLILFSRTSAKLISRLIALSHLGQTKPRESQMDPLATASRMGLIRIAVKGTEQCGQGSIFISYESNI